MSRSWQDREEFFSLVCAGWSLNAAGRAVGVSSPCAVKWWRQGVPMDIKPRSGAVGGLGVGSIPDDPGLTGRVRRPLTLQERILIANGLEQGMSYAQIARLIGRNKSVVCREVARHRDSRGEYHPAAAHMVAWTRRRRPKPYRLATNRALCGQIEEWMSLGWSPQLIARSLAADPSRSKMDRVSHETIYRALYVQTRGQLRKNLHRCLSTKRAARKKRVTPRQDSTYRDAFTIADRPAEVEDRAVSGHWEGDLILGPANRSAVGTLVERSTRFVILLHLPGRHDADTVAEAMIAQMSKLPAHLRRSITWDRGRELARYPKIQMELDTTVYFCDPHSPWQRGSNENTNRLLRFWLPKGEDLSRFTAHDLDQIAATLNARPRPTLNMLTPAQALAEHLNQLA